MKQLAVYPAAMRWTSLPPQERPARRVAEAPDACNLVELLAALVGGPHQVEIAQTLLVRFGSLRAIRQASASEIAQVQGIGPRSAARLLSALEIGRRLAVESAAERPFIYSPADAAALVQLDLSLLEQEELWVLLLDTRNRLIEIEKLYRGSVNASQVRVGEVFKAAIRRNASSILIAHNHPSGDSSASAVTWL